MLELNKPDNNAAKLLLKLRSGLKLWRKIPSEGVEML
jgi:hypothetical protein